jgi:hypothetical protein
MPAIQPAHLPLRPKICAWCESLMGVEAPRGSPQDERPSHGLCSECTEQLIESLTTEPEPMPRRRRHPSPRRVARVFLG